MLLVVGYPRRVKTQFLYVLVQHGGNLNHAVPQDQSPGLSFVQKRLLLLIYPGKVVASKPRNLQQIRLPLALASAKCDMCVETDN